MKAEIIAVGSELLTHERQDTNSLFISEKLFTLGVKVQLKTIAGDDRKLLCDVLRQALARSELIFLTGGLGPTEDDLTRDAVAEVLGRPLVFDGKVLDGIASKFRASGMSMPEINRRQAFRFEDGDVYDNPNGTAPGLHVQDRGRHVFLLPGPPREMRPMLENHLLPYLRKLLPPTRILHRRLKITGLSESRVDSIAAPLYRGYPEIATTILAAPGEILLDFFAQGLGENEANAKLDELVGTVREALGVAIYSCAETLEEVVGRLLVEQAKTVAVAESCTGGSIGERLTRVAGSSRYFVGGVISYSNELKQSLAQVPVRLLEQHGAVSAEVAEAMAAGVRKSCGASIGLAVTGIAGPGGGTVEKPVGLVFIGLADENASRAERFQFRGDREIIRLRTTQTALDVLRRKLLQAPD